MTRHLIIPDTQVRAGVPTEHLTAAGNYIVAKQPDVIIMLGDFADFPSLSKYANRTEIEGKRVMEDIEVAREAMRLLLEPIKQHNKKQAKKKKPQYKPRMVLCMGNHEHRVARFVQDNPVLIGVFDVDDPVGYKDFGWELVQFEHIIVIDGVHYSHYFRNPQSLKKGILGGTMDNKLNKLGFSFVMGHQQHLQYGIQYLMNGEVRQGIVAGAFYQHDEHYLGPQGNDYWRGVIVLNEVHNGRFDPCFVSLKFLMENYL